MKQHDKIFSQYAASRLVFGKTLVIPFQVLYRDHKGWAGVLALSAKDFKDRLLLCGVVYRARGKGKLRTVAIGVGTRPQEASGERSRALLAGPSKRGQRKRKHGC